MKRNQRGSGIVEGAVGLVLVLGSGICSSLLVVNSGIGVLFQSKVSLVAAQAAQFAAAHQIDSNVESETEAFVQALMPNVGLAATSLDVSVTQTTVNGVEGELVTITNDFPVFGNASFLPKQIRLSDTEFASFCVVVGTP